MDKKIDEKMEAKIKAKIDKGQTMTYEEDIYYFTVMLNFTREEAEGIITRNNNKDKNTIID